MVHVLAEVPGLDAETEATWDAILEHLEHASASIGTSARGLSVTLTVEASCPADAERMGEWMVRPALAASGLRAPSSVQSEIEFAAD